MKVLLINGSPHEHGCTNRALEEVAASLKTNGVDSEIFWIGKGAIHGLHCLWSVWWKQQSLCV